MPKDCADCRRADCGSEFRNSSRLDFAASDPLDHPLRRRSRNLDEQRRRTRASGASETKILRPRLGPRSSSFDHACRNCAFSEKAECGLRRIAALAGLER
eukprot:1240943-Alexandrium_andersonii.AAC.1